MILMLLKPVEGKEHKMQTSSEVQNPKEGESEHDVGLSNVEGSTCKRQIAYNQALKRIRDDLKKRVRPLPVLFDEDGKWAF